jgi:ribosomal protein L7Ae-like RNA K-turn-binding protein
MEGNAGGTRGDEEGMKVSMVENLRGVRAERGTGQGDEGRERGKQEELRRGRSSRTVRTVSPCRRAIADPRQPEFHVPLEAISPIASPLASKKLSKKLFRTVKRASKVRQLKRGVKEVVKALRKGEKGLLLLASNITPVDVISHLPLMAEEAPGVEYCWVLSKCVAKFHRLVQTPSPIFTRLVHIRML